MTYPLFQAALRAQLPSLFPENLVFSEPRDANREDVILLKTPRGELLYTVSVKEAFRRHLGGTALSDILLSIRNDFLESTYPRSMSQLLPDWKTARRRLFLRLLPGGGPARLSRPFGDLVLVCRLRSRDGDSPSAEVTEEMLYEWKIGREELFAAAFRSAPCLYPPLILPTSEMLERLRPLTGEDAGSAEPAAAALYVLSNTVCRFGAAAAAYPGVLKELLSRIGEYYLLPSSVHEWLLLPASPLVVPSRLDQMIRSVNRDILMPGDLLSDHAYRVSAVSSALPLSDPLPDQPAVFASGRDLILDEPDLSE